MKSLRNRILSLLVLFGFILAFSQLASPDRIITIENKKLEVIQGKKETKASFFPILFAGTLTIIQKVYLKKSE